MDFIEGWLGVSPDSGGGSLVALLLLAFMVVVYAIISGIPILRGLVCRSRSSAAQTSKSPDRRVGAGNPTRCGNARIARA